MKRYYEMLYNRNKYIKIIVEDFNIFENII
jgi:hypothetical protein